MQGYYHRKSKVGIAVLAAALTLGGLGLSGCSSDESENSSDSSSAAATFNNADVAFASEMKAHHVQALEMVDLADGRPVSDEFSTLALQIKEAQTPEIEKMDGWFEVWGAPSDSMGGMDMGSHSMPGMMSDDAMGDLESASDSDFEDEWLRLMIEHHEGAVVMAQTELAKGKDGQALALAQEIIDSQSIEIDQMKAMLES